MTHSYDAADRLTDPGVTYDSFGRTTTLPAAAGPSGAQLTPTYNVNDLVASVAGSTWTLDQTQQRLLSWTTGATTKTNHYDSASGDSPAWIDEGSSAWTVNVGDLLGSLAATVTNTGAVTHQYANLHGDTAATCAGGSAAPTVAPDYDEFGNTPTGSSSPGRYGWLGAKQRSSADAGGHVLMGVRLYNPFLGRFLTVDPVIGGSANAYDYVYQDPINKFDLDGRCWGGGDWCHVIKHAKWAYRQAIRAYAVVPYAQYYAGYRYNRWASRRHRWHPGHLLRPLGWLAQADGITRDVAVDWVKGHTGFKERIDDEHTYGHLNPFHGPKRGHTWLPGLYSRRGRFHLDWAW